MKDLRKQYMQNKRDRSEGCEHSFSSKEELKRKERNRCRVHRKNGYLKSNTGNIAHRRSRGSRAWSRPQERPKKNLHALSEYYIGLYVCTYIHIQNIYIYIYIHIYIYNLRTLYIRYTRFIETTRIDETYWHW